MSEWECEQTAFTNAPRTAVWTYWTDLSNHARMEPGVERIELDGPFATGTRGRTIADEFEQEWELTDVVEGKRFAITGFAPDAKGTLVFSWNFRDQGEGTCITYRIRASGPDVAQHLGVFRQMERAAPAALARLAADLDRLADALE